jgi:transposase
MADVPTRLSNRLPVVLRKQWNMVGKLNEQIAQAEQRLLAWTMRAR